MAQPTDGGGAHFRLLPCDASDKWKFMRFCCLCASFYMISQCTLLFNLIFFRLRAGDTFWYWCIYILSHANSVEKWRHISDAQNRLIFNIFTTHYINIYLFFAFKLISPTPILVLAQCFAVRKFWRPKCRDIGAMSNMRVFFFIFLYCICAPHQRMKMNQTMREYIKKYGNVWLGVRAR